MVFKLGVWFVVFNVVICCLRLLKILLWVVLLFSMIVFMLVSLVCVFVVLMVMICLCVYCMDNLYYCGIDYLYIFLREDV